jgi:hypothetical protein
MKKNCSGSGFIKILDLPDLPFILFLGFISMNPDPAPDSDSSTKKAKDKKNYDFYCIVTSQ